MDAKLLASGAVPPTTLNPNDKDSNITLSLGNLRAVNGSNVVNAAVRATRSKSTGLWYFEWDYDTLHASMGVAQASAALSSPGGGSSIGIYNGSITVSGTVVGPTWTGLSGSAAGTWAGCAVDLDNRRIWFRNTGTPSNWNGSTGNNPATNTGGVDISALTGPLFPIMMLNNTSGAQGNVNFGASAFVATPPTGFKSWDSK